MASPSQFPHKAAHPSPLTQQESDQRIFKKPRSRNYRPTQFSTQEQDGTPLFTQLTSSFPSSGNSGTQPPSISGRSIEPVNEFPEQASPLLIKLDTVDKKILEKEKRIAELLAQIKNEFPEKDIPLLIKLDILEQKILEREKRVVELIVQLKYVDEIISDISELANSFLGIDLSRATISPRFKEKLQDIQGRIRAVYSARSEQRADLERTDLPQATDTSLKMMPSQTTLPGQGTVNHVGTSHSNAWNFKVQSLSDLISRAEDLLHKGNLNEALKVANKVLRKDIGNSRAFICKANALRLLGRFDESIAIIDNMLTGPLISMDAEERRQALLCKSYALISLNRLEEAMTAIEEI